MDTNARFARIATATPEILERIDAILEGKEPFKEPQKPNNRLLTVAEACRELNMKFRVACFIIHVFERAFADALSET